MVGLFGHTILLSYERVINDNFSIVGTCGWGSQSTSGDAALKNYENEYGGYYFSFQRGNVNQTIKTNNYYDLEFRFYLSPENELIPSGSHIGPSLSFANFGETFDFYDSQGTLQSSTKNSYELLSLNLNVGMQFLFRRVVTFDFLLAPGYGKVSKFDKDHSGTEGFSGSGITVKLGAFVGIAFGR